MSKNFSSKRLQKYIDGIEKGTDFEFSDLTKIGGSRSKIASFLRFCSDVEHIEKRVWRRI